MRTLLFVAHLFVVLLTLSSAWVELVRSTGRVLSVATPSELPAESLPRLAVFVLLATIWSMSILLRKPLRDYWPGLAIHGSWLVLFTWYGWFSASAPFRIMALESEAFEMTGNADASNAIVVVRIVKSLTMYLGLVWAYTLIPLFHIRVNGRRANGPEMEASANERQLLAISGVLYGVLLSDIFLNWFPPFNGISVIDTGVFVAAYLFVSIPAARGSRSAMMLGFAEVLILPLTWLADS